LQVSCNFGGLPSSKEGATAYACQSARSASAQDCCRRSARPAAHRCTRSPVGLFSLHRASAWQASTPGPTHASVAGFSVRASVSPNPVPYTTVRTPRCTPGRLPAQSAQPASSVPPGAHHARSTALHAWSGAAGWADGPGTWNHEALALGHRDLVGAWPGGVCAARLVGAGAQPHGLAERRGRLASIAVILLTVNTFSPPVQESNARQSAARRVPCSQSHKTHCRSASQTAVQGRNAGEAPEVSSAVVTSTVRSRRRV
jgi:hypothetical protein